MPDLLEFEEPVGVLLKEIEALSLMPRTPDRERSIETLRRRADEIRAELYANLTPWQRVLVARHPNRPNTLDYVERLFTGWDELHGDRRFADDHAIVCGFADYRGQPVAWSATRRGRRHQAENLPELRLRAPRGVSQGAAVMQLAQKFSRPIVVFIDTPAAYPGVESEERGVAEAIAFNLREMMMLEVPIVVLVCGEGGSGGALGIAIGDRVLMQEFSVYSVIPPEGCAAILWRDREPQGRGRGGVEDHGARHARARPDRRRSCRNRPAARTTTADAATALVDQALSAALADVSALDCRGATAARATTSSARWAKRAAPSSMRTRCPATMEPKALSREARHDEVPSLAAPAVQRRTRPRRWRPPSACIRSIARLLCLRGLADADRSHTVSAIHRSITFTIPSSWPTWIGRSIGIERALAQRERIAIHGDYDVDGITSTVILRRALELLGGDVVHFIPERLRDGYGLQRPAIDRLHAERVALDRLGRLRHPEHRSGRCARASSASI